MTSESNPLSDKRVKVTIFIFAQICCVVAYFFSVCEITGSFHFVCLPHGRTGEPLSIFSSLFVYLFQYYIVSTVIAGIIGCLSFFYSTFLNRGNYEQKTKSHIASLLNDYSISLSFIVTRIVVGIIFLLNMFGIMAAR